MSSLGTQERDPATQRVVPSRTVLAAETKTENRETLKKGGRGVGKVN
jgi:hypothetical protein